LKDFNYKKKKIEIFNQDFLQLKKNIVIFNEDAFYHFFCGGGGLNPEPYIYYALSLSTKLCSRGQTFHYLKKSFNKLDFVGFLVKF